MEFGQAVAGCAHDQPMIQPVWPFQKFRFIETSLSKGFLRTEYIGMSMLPKNRNYVE